MESLLQASLAFMSCHVLWPLLPRFLGSRSPRLQEHFLGNLCGESWALPSHTHPGCPYLPDACSQDWVLTEPCHFTKHWLAAVRLRNCPTGPVQTGSLHKGHQQAYPRPGHCSNMWVIRLAHLVLSLEILGQMLT